MFESGLHFIDMKLMYLGRKTRAIPIAPKAIMQLIDATNSSYTSSRAYPTLPPLPKVESKVPSIELSSSLAAPLAPFKKGLLKA